MSREQEIRERCQRMLKPDDAKDLDQFDLHARVDFVFILSLLDTTRTELRESLAIADNWRQSHATLRTSMEARITLLMKAIETYGAHLPWCLHKEGASCTCGYAESMRPTEGG